MSEQLHGASEDASVILDIGGDVGALVLLTAADMLGAEIEISPLDQGAADVFQAEHPHVPDDHDHGDEHDHEHDHAHSHEHGHTHEHARGAAGAHGHTPGRTHVAVRERHSPNGIMYAAIYPGLYAGRYQLFGVDGTEADIVEITGGEVSQVDWS